MLLGLKRHGHNFTKVIVPIENHIHSDFVLPVPSTTTANLPGTTGHRRQTVVVESSHTDINPHVLSTKADLTLYDRANLSRPRTDTEVYIYPFLEQAQQLLDCRPIFQDTTLLITNPECPWLPYHHPPDQMVDDILTGSWYRDTLADLGMQDITTFECWVARGKPFLLPLVLYMDKTGTDTLCRYTLEPVIFSFAILRRELLVQSFAWKHLGFVPDQNRMSSAQHESQRKGKEGKGRSCRNYHNCLEPILRNLIDLHATTDGRRRPVPLRMTIGSESHVVSAYMPLAYVIGDNKSNDFLCGKIASHSLDNQRVCRSCNCPTEEADNPYYRCRPLTQQTVDDAVRRVTEARSRMKDHPSQAGASDTLVRAESVLAVDLHRYYLENAFSKIWFGNSTTGIHGHTPPDVLHSARKGHVYRNLMLIVSALGKRGKELLDNQCAKLLCSTRFHARGRFPRTSFPNGFSNLTKLTATELVGCSFSLMLFLFTPKGYNLMRKRLCAYITKQRKENKVGFDARLATDDTTAGRNEVFSDDDGGADDSSNPQRKRANRRNPQQEPVRRTGVTVEEEVDNKINDIRELLEMELAFDAWCSNGPYWSLDESRQKEVSYRMKISKMLDRMITTLPRSDGNGWKLQKTHEVLHIPESVTRFGHSRNFDSGHGESALKDKAKKPAMTSQKRSYHQFQQQVCARIDSLQVKAQVYNSMGQLPGRQNDTLYRVRHRVHEKRREEIRCGTRTSQSNPTVTEIAHSLEKRLWSMKIYLEEDDHRQQRVSYDFEIEDSSKADTFPPFAKNQLLKWVVTNFPALESYDIHITAYSEAVRKRIVNGELEFAKEFRAHFNFRGEGPWYDWVLSKWDEEDALGMPGNNHFGLEELAKGQPPSDHGLYPAKTLAFFEIRAQERVGIFQPTPLTETEEEFLQEKLCLMHSTVKCSRDEDDPFSDSVLTCKYQLEYHPSTKEAILRVVSVATLEDHCFVIENTPGVHEKLVAPKKEEATTVRYVHDQERTWGSLF